MYFPEEDSSDDETEGVIDPRYRLEDDELFTEYEIRLMRLASMRIKKNPIPKYVDDTEARLAYCRSEDEKELAERRKLLKRHLSRDEEEAVPSKRKKPNPETSPKEEEPGEPGTSQKRYDRSFGEVDEKSEPEAKKKKMTKDI